MAQKHGAGENGGQRVGDVLVGVLGRGAVRRLVQIDLAAHGSGGQHAQRAGNHRSLVGENVAERVLHDHHIEIARTLHQVHRHGIDELVLQLHIGKLFGDLDHRVAPELRYFEHIGLVHAGHQLAALLRQLEGGAGYAFHFAARVAHGVIAFALFLVPAAGLTVIEAAEQFADK